MPWVIAFLEGLSTLAVEVIAIRLAVPVVGSSATLNGITLAIVLLALSAGYWRGGTLSARRDPHRLLTALSRNLLVAAALYGVLAFPWEARLLEKTLDIGLAVPLAIGATACLLYLVPVYLASQTVPMLAELTNTEGKAGKASGRVLFFSTLGSVVGGIVTPVWLFPSLGVQRTTYVVCALLVVAGVAALGRSRIIAAATSAIVVLALLAAAHVLLAPKEQGFAFDSAYQTFRIVEDENSQGRAERVLLLGGDRASGVYARNGETSFSYVREAEKALTETRAADILVIGAAGFTFPRDAARLAWVRRIDAVDVDPAVKWIAEREFLKQPLDPKVHFFALSARYALHRLRREGRRYGLTLVDAYYGKSIPPELLTQEFFADVAAISDHTVVNVIMDADLESNFAHSLLASFRGAFPKVWVKPLVVEDQDLNNVLVSDWQEEGSEAWNSQGRAYRDDLSSADRDWVRLAWGQSE